MNAPSVLRELNPLHDGRVVHDHHRPMERTVELGPKQKPNVIHDSPKGRGFDLTKILREAGSELLTPTEHQELERLVGEYGKLFPKLADFQPDNARTCYRKAREKFEARPDRDSTKALDDARFALTEAETRFREVKGAITALLSRDALALKSSCHARILAHVEKVESEIREIEQKNAARCGHEFLASDTLLALQACLRTLKASPVIGQYLGSPDGLARFIGLPA